LKRFTVVSSCGTELLRANGDGQGSNPLLNHMARPKSSRERSAKWKNVLTQLMFTESMKTIVTQSLSTHVASG